MGASNTTTSSSAAKICVADMRSGQSSAVAGLSMLDKLRHIARAASNAGCGNCGEHAAITFLYLYDRGLRPVEFATLSNGDHAFAMLGRPHMHSYSAGVVVDAYYGKAYPVAQASLGSVDVYRED